MSKLQAAFPDSKATHQYHLLDTLLQKKEFLMVKTGGSCFFTQATGFSIICQANTSLLYTL